MGVWKGYDVNFVDMTATFVPREPWGDVFGSKCTYFFDELLHKANIHGNAALFVKEHLGHESLLILAAMKYYDHASCFIRLMNERELEFYLDGMDEDFYNDFYGLTVRDGSFDGVIVIEY